VGEGLSNTSYPRTGQTRQDSIIKYAQNSDLQHPGGIKNPE
jgi:hypothetical protein